MPSQYGRRKKQIEAMNSASSPSLLALLFFLAVALSPEATFRALGQQTDWTREETQNGVVGRRKLMSFKEKPAGSNFTFECAPSGPCVPCLYSEKGDEKYRCSETGYRIPLKCVEIKDSITHTKRTNSQNARYSLEISDAIEKLHNASHVDRVFATSHRSLLDDSSTSDNNSQAYITYRSCIPPVTEEKLSVLSFEGVVIFLLVISGSIIYLRKRKAVSVSSFASGAPQTNSRF